MAIVVRCPECEQRYKLADSVRQKPIRCKKCGATIQAIPAPPPKAAPPAPPPIRRSDEIVRRSSQRKRGASGMLIGGIIGGVAAVGGVIALIVIVISNSDTKEPASPQQGHAAVKNEKTPNGGPPKQKTTAKTPNGKSKTPPGNSQPEKVTWTVRPDPLPKPFAYSSNLPPKIPILSSSDGGQDFYVFVNVIFSNHYSPYVLLGKNDNPKEHRELWNLSTGQKEAEFHAKVQFGARTALSPDGEYVAKLVDNERAVEIRSVKSGKKVQTLAPEFSPGVRGRGLIRRIIFPQPNVAILVRADKRLGLSHNSLLLEKWDVASGKPLGVLRSNRALTESALAVSPGGKLLTIRTIENYGRFGGRRGNTAIDFVDVTDMKVVGRIPVAEKTLFVNYMAFSPDGTMLAAFLGDLKRTVVNGKRQSHTVYQLKVWDLRKGELTRDHTYKFDPSIGFSVCGLGVHWFPDNRTVMVNGFCVIDVPTGKMYALKRSDVALRRPFGTGRVLVLYTPAPLHHHLAVEPLMKK